MLNCKLLFSSKERIRQYYQRVPGQYDEFLLYYLLLYVNDYFLTFKKICLIFQTERDLQRCAQHSTHADVKQIYIACDRTTYIRLNHNFQSLILTLTTVI